MGEGRRLIVVWFLLGVALLLLPYAEIRESVGLGIVAFAATALAVVIMLRSNL